MLRSLVIALVLFAGMFAAKAQPVYNCGFTVLAEWRDSLYTVQSGNGVLFLDFKTSHLSFEANLNTFSMGIDTVDRVLGGLEGKIRFDADLGISDLKLIEVENKESFIPVAGVVLINGVSSPVNCLYKLFKLNNEREENRTGIRMTMMMDLDPNVYRINDWVPGLYKPIKAELRDAMINTYN